MNYELLKAQLTQAEEFNNAGKYEEAEMLATTVLAELEHASEYDKDQTVTEQKILHCSVLNSLANTNWRRGDLQEALSLARVSLDIAEEYALTKIKANALNILGNVYYSLGSYDKALEYLAKAMSGHEELGAKSGVALVTGNIGSVYQKLGSYDKALEYFAKALSAYEELGAKSGVASVTGNIGNVYASLGTYDKALENYANALSRHEELGEKSVAANVTGNIGNVYNNLGSYDKALEYYAKALSAHEELGAKSLVASVTGNIGNVYFSLGSYDKALEYFAKALATHEELGSKSGVALVTGSIGTVYLHLGSHDKALEYYAKALSANEELGRKSSVAHDMGNIGGAYFELKEYATALDYQKLSLALAEEIGDRRQTGYWCEGIGNTLSAMGKNQEAMEFLQKSLRLRRDEIQTNEGVASTLVAIGVLLVEQNKNDEALEKLKEGLALAEELGEKAQAFQAHKELAAILKKKGKTAAAFSHFEKYHELEKEVQSEEAKKHAELMEYRRKIEDSERDRQVKLARFQEQEKILHNILPSQIANRMIDGEKTIADSHENVSVFFSDIVGFTKLSQRVNAQELVGMLNGIFTQFDQIARKHGLEKIKTIGDAYMAVCGAPISLENHAEKAALFALEVAELMKNYHTDLGEKIDIRIGLHTGSVVAGIIGENKFAYDMWGDAVNTASRMESHGEPGKIHVSEEFKHAVETLHATSLQFIRRDEMEIKGKGMMKTYYLQQAN